MLHELGYDADSCASIPQAVELLHSSIYQSRKYKVAIIDLVIGESASGTDLFKTLLELDPDLKGILSTGYIEDPVVENYEKYGFSTVLLKPYQIKDLAKVMESVLDVS